MFVLCFLCCLFTHDDAYFKSPSTQIRESIQSSFKLNTHLKNYIYIFNLNLENLFDLVATVFLQFFVVKYKYCRQRNNC